MYWYLKDLDGESRLSCPDLDSQLCPSHGILFSQILLALSPIKLLTRVWTRLPLVLFLTLPKTFTRMEPY